MKDAAVTSRTIVFNVWYLNHVLDDPLVVEGQPHAVKLG
jgi:hypothetical protein